MRGDLPAVFPMIDSHETLATRSQVDEATAITLKLPDLPPELILRIASFLEVRDLLALRRVRFTLTNSNSGRELIGTK
jgi:hypothetical protein